MPNANVTPHLALPLMDAAQAQKHVTHNEALLILDCLSQISVLAQSTTPPANPVEGASYLVSARATGVFSGADRSIAAFQAGAWRFLAPTPGWIAYVQADNLFLMFNGLDWIDLPIRRADVFAVGASPDTNTPFLAKLNTAVWTAKSTGEGGTGDLRVALNKAAPGNVSSQLYQSNWSGRAETGLTGDDNFHVKVSPDGSVWRDAMIADRSSGAVAFPQGVAGGDRMGFRNRLRNAQFSINQRAVSATVILAAGAYGHDGVKAGASGATYTFTQSGLDTTLTIISGSLILPIEANLIEGGAYTLAHDGSAQARVWQGGGVNGSGSYVSASRSSGGLTTATLAANTQTNVEFTTGAILRPQLEPGAVATAFERRPPSLEILLCQRYYVTTYAGVPSGSASGAGSMTFWLPVAATFAASSNITYPVAMRTTPTVTIYSPQTGASGKAYIQNQGVDVPVYLMSFSSIAVTIAVLNTATNANDYMKLQFAASAEI